MERGRIAKSKGVGDEGAPSEYYQAGDLWVGGHVEFNSHRFVLIDADEYALRYMEAHPAQVGVQSECVAVYDRGSITLSPFQFPHADVDLVLGKLVGPATGHTPTIQAAFREMDPTGSGHTSLQQFTYVRSPLPPRLH